MVSKKDKSRTDPHVLYQLSVQSPEFELDFIDDKFKKIRGRKPNFMREDFCGTALSSCEWVKRSRKNRAIAIDINPEVLEWCQKHNYSELTRGQKQRLQIVNKNVLSVKTPKVDVCQAFNFSYWTFQERRVMLRYFKNIKNSLCDDGLLFLDSFGGYEAHKVQIEKRKVDGFTFLWEQKKYNAVTGEMHCRIHFRFPGGRKIDNAFSYVWRLWGAREIREVLVDAGFKCTTMYLQEFDEKTDEPLDSFVATDYAEDYACWIGYIVAQK